jgi:hypothetical protein
MTVQPFEINIEPAVLDDLRDRLRGTRWPDEIDDAGWDYGMDGSVLRSFVHTWLEEFDWPTQQTRLNQYSHLRVDIEGLGVQHPARPSSRRCWPSTGAAARLAELVRADAAHRAAAY